MHTEKNPILIDIPMPITTPRLTLRPAMPGDGTALHAAKADTMADLLRWMDWAKADATVEDDEIVVRESYARFIRREDMMLFAFENATGEFIAGTGLHRFDWRARRFEIGYWVRGTRHREGFATEITNALTRYAFNALTARRVEIFHAGGNDRSAAVIRKLGFTPEGIMHNHTMLPDGTMTDHHVYARHDIDGLPEMDIRWGPT